MEIGEVGANDLRVYLNLCQAYEAEFSAIIGKAPGPTACLPWTRFWMPGSRGVWGCCS